MRLADILYTQGLGTRRACATLIGRGSVQVQGQTLTDVDTDLPVAEGFAFSVDGVVWPYHVVALVMLHKPAGYECSRQPGRHTSVLSLLPAALQRRGVQPVGRLDQDTTGLLLLTDDGALIHRLTSPRHHVPKVYEVLTKHPLTDDVPARLLAGVVLHDDPAPARATACQVTAEYTLHLTITDGRYHQVKRMLAAVGNRVQALHRSAFGPWLLPPDLAPGHWRWLDAQPPAGLDAPVSVACDWPALRD